METVAHASQRPAFLALAAVLAWILLWPMMPAKGSDAVLVPLTGTFAAAGTDASNGQPYRGTVRLTIAGNALRYHGDYAGTRYSGVALYGPETGVLAVTFHQAGTGHSGVLLMHARPDGWEGTWTWSGDAQGRIGTERWTMR